MNASSLSVRVILALVLMALPAAAQQGSGFKFLEVKVVDPDGQPVTDAEVEVSLSGTQFPMPTDDKGVLSLNVPEGGDSATRFIVKHEGHVRVGVSWEPGDTIPEQLTIQLEKAVAIGGIVHDENGDPIEGATVEGAVLVHNRTDWLPGKGEVVPYFHGELARTGPDGRWQSNTAPARPMPLRLKFSHPDYKSDGSYSFRGGTWDELRSLDKIVVLERGIDLRGTITDPEGGPVADAKVAVGASRFMSDRQVVQTNAAGEYHLKQLAEGPTILTVMSPDWAPDTRTVTAKKNAEPVDFQLQPPRSVRFRVVDPEGQPVPGVTIIPERWGGHEGMEDPFGRKATDADGLWEWHAAPPDEVQYSIFGGGRFGVPDWQATFSASDEIQEVTMLPAPVVSGTVVDKNTGKPIEKFRYTDGVWWEPRYDSPVIQSGDWEAGSDGKFRFAMESGCVKFMMRVEADGYRPVESRAILPEEGEVSLTFEMEAGSGPTGIVKLPDGSPAAGVKVAMATAKQQVGVYNGEMETDFSAGHDVTDADGRFEMPFPEGDFAVVCVADAGWAVAYADQQAASVEATLEPWGRVEGVALRGSEPRTGEQISLYRRQSFDVNSPRVYFQHHTTTDDNGRFRFDRLQAGPTEVSRRVRYADRGDSWMSANSHTVHVDIKPNETDSIQLGGTGRNVTGRLTVPADSADKVAWRMGSVSLTQRRVPTGVEGFFYRIGTAIGQASSGNFDYTTPATDSNPPTYSSAIDDQGGFEIEDVPPGDYNLVVILYPPKADVNSSWNAISRLNKPVSIPEAGEGVVDLGKHELIINAR